MRVQTLMLCGCAALAAIAGCKEQTTVAGSSTTGGSTTTSSSAGGAASGGGQAAGGAGGFAGAGGQSSGGGGAGGLGGAGGAQPTSQVLWGKAFSDPLSTVMLDASHTGVDIAITGYFRSNIDFGGGLLMGAAGREGYLARFDAAGNHLHSQAYVAASSSGGVVGSAVAPDGQGGLYFGGIYSISTDLGGGPLPAPQGGLNDYDAMLGRFDASGSHQWSAGYVAGDPNSLLYGLGGHKLHALGGDVIVLLDAGGSADLGLGPMSAVSESDLFVARIDSQGQTLWQRQLGGSGSATAHFARDLTNRIVLGGHFSADLQVSPQLTLSVAPGSAGTVDAMLLELDPATGDTLWAQSFGDADNDIISAIGGAPNGDIVVGGRFFGTLDLGSGGVLSSPNALASFVARFGPTGQHQSSSMNSQLINFNSVAFDATGRFVLCGHQPDRLRLLGFDAASQPLVDHPFPPHTAPSNSHRLSCASHPSGNFILYGQFEETLDLGLPMTFTAAGNEDSFLALFEL